MKKILAFVMVTLMLFNLVACGGSKTTADAAKAKETIGNAEDFKVGLICIGDENEGYSFSHIDGIKKAMKALGLSENQIIFKYGTPESEAALDAAVDLAENGCKLIISDSYSHQTFTEQAANDYPDIEFVAMTGDTAKKANLPNFHNAFTRIYQGRYLGGVAAGLKIKELIDDGKLKAENYDAKGNVKIGYVGAFPYAEVKSGYTSYFLGVRSIIENVVMDVKFVNSWSDFTAEQEAATSLIADGCVIVSQHADSTGVPTATQEAFEAGKVAYCVGYNIDMQKAAPDSALVSMTNNWSVYYEHIIDSVMKGEKFEVNWAEGFETDSVRMTEFTKNCAKGTEEKCNEILEDIKSGKLQVFDTSKFTVDGKEVTSAFATDTDGDWVNDADEAVFDGYFHESYFQAAPAFALDIDGITMLN